MMRAKSVAVLAAASGLLLGSGAAYAAPDVASYGAVAGNPYTVKNTCGGDYRVIQKREWRAAVTYLTWNGTSTCAVTLKKTNIGRYTRVGVYIGYHGGPMKVEHGDRKFFAGPNYKTGRHCIAYGGTTGRDGNWKRWTHNGATTC